MEKEAVESIPEGKLEEGSEKDEPRTFIRVKRKITEDPAAQLILSYKKQRIASGSHVDKVTYETINNVLEFAGTHHPHEPAGKFVSDYVKLGATVSSNGEEETEVGRSRRAKMQQEARRKSAKGRYKMVNAKRGLDEEAPASDSKPADESNYLFNMFDLVEPDDHKSKPAEKEETKDEDVITCNGVPMVHSKDAETRGKTDEQKHDYVYDVYTLKSPLLHVEDLHVDVEHLWESELVVEAPDSDDDGPRDEADTDSNDENNPNNSYPEEDSDFSDAEGNEDEYYASYEQPEYDPDDDDGEGYFDAVQHQGSKVMKALSKHLHQIKLETAGGPGIKDSLDEFSSNEENVGSSEDENDY